jgi:hypothetical protein
LSVDIGNDNVRAFLGESARVGFADTVGRAGDDRDFILESHGRSPAATIGNLAPAAMLIERGEGFNRAKHRLRKRRRAWAYLKPGVLPSSKALS